MLPRISDKDFFWEASVLLRAASRRLCASSAGIIQTVVIESVSVISKRKDLSLHETPASPRLGPRHVFRTLNLRVQLCESLRHPSFFSADVEAFSEVWDIRAPARERRQFFSHGPLLFAGNEDCPRVAFHSRTFLRPSTLMTYSSCFTSEYFQ